MLIENFADNKLNIHIQYQHRLTIQPIHMKIKITKGVNINKKHNSPLNSFFSFNFNLDETYKR
jgi:hypothetical protein